jgi:hypothetical protein
MQARQLRKKMVYIGTWNVMTMLKVGRMNESQIDVKNTITSNSTTRI